MFLSRVAIDRSCTLDYYQLHRSLWALFPDRPEAKRDFLFHIEEQRVGHDTCLLLQSAVEPVKPAGEGLRLIAKKPYPLQLRQGQRLSFLLAANPVKTIKDERERRNAKGNIKACRIPLLKDSEQRQWLERKLAGAAILDAVLMRPNSPLYFRKQGKAGKIVPMTFEGVIQVTDPASLTKLIHDGIGPAKAFGCGLMLVRRA